MSSKKNLPIVAGTKLTLVGTKLTFALPSPTSKLAEADWGALVQNKFRYQSGYGVILLVGAACGNQDYTAIWCEQEDDFLAEVNANVYDSYQVKTQDPELGPWDTKKEGFLAAIGVFANLQRRYGPSIRTFNFVSNTKLLNSNAERKVYKCPAKLAEAVRTARSASKLSPGFRKSLEVISLAADCTLDEAFGVVKKLRFATGPSQDALLAELATNHLSHLSGCQAASPGKLKRAALAAIHRLDEAASLSSQDPSRHYACLDPKVNKAQLLAKRVSVEDLKRCVEQVVLPGFRYLPSVELVLRKVMDQGLIRFVRKLRHAELDHYVDTLRNQTIAAEEVLLDLATRADGQSDLAHLRGLVKAECDFAHLEASKAGIPFGKEMLLGVSKRLRDLSKEEPGKACGQPAEVLMGLAGMLTEECEVWWSEKFDVEKAS